MIATATASAIGLIIGNFLYQAVLWQDWGSAVERSFFQIGAIAITTALIWRNHREDAR